MINITVGTEVVTSSVFNPPCVKVWMIMLDDGVSTAAELNSTV